MGRSNRNSGLTIPNSASVAARAVCILESNLDRWLVEFSIRHRRRLKSLFHGGTKYLLADRAHSRVARPIACSSVSPQLAETGCWRTVDDVLRIALKIVLAFALVTQGGLV